MNIVLNGHPRTVDDAVTLADVVLAVLAEKAAGPVGASVHGRGLATAVDGVVVPRDRRASTLLADGARIEIVTAVQGG